MGGVFQSIGKAVGSVGGLTSEISKGFTPQNEFNAQSPLDVNSLNNQIAQSQGNLSTVQGNQSALAQALLAQSQGQGPNPAQAMLNQATNQNIAQNTGMIASQKGINPALAIRQASQNAQAANQQAAGQGAILGAQQQLNAQAALGNVYGQQAGENLQNISTSGQLANQASLGSQGINAGTSAQNAAANQTTNSGFLNSIAGAGKSAAAGMADGGMVQHYASGGGVEPFQKGDFGASNASQNIAQQMLHNAGVMTYQSGVTPLDTGSGSSDFMDQLKGAGSAAFYKGGPIPSHFHMAAKIYHPQAFEPAKQTMQLKAEGGKVPGKAKIKGDSPKNDTVPTMLSPGEIVIPRSIVESENPEQKAAEFVAKKLKEKSINTKDPHGDFKDALKKAISSRKAK